MKGLVCLEGGFLVGGRWDFGSESWMRSFGEKVISPGFTAGHLGFSYKLEGDSSLLGRLLRNYFPQV